MLHHSTACLAKCDVDILGFKEVETETRCWWTMAQKWHPVFLIRFHGTDTGDIDVDAATLGHAVEALNFIEDTFCQQERSLARIVVRYVLCKDS
jgi:hypothetical protein